MPRSPLIDLDAHSTTPVDPRVVKAMQPFFSHYYGNPSSRSVLGQKAELAVETARGQVAALIGAMPEEIIFTSSATESNNLALKGVAEIYRESHPRFITQVTEHRSVLDPCRYLEQQGAGITYLGVDAEGRIRIDELKAEFKHSVTLVSVMFANNEIGAIQPIHAIGKLAKSAGVLFHTDAAQAAGKLPIDVDEMGIDLLSFSAHKMNGPKGVAALYVRRKNPRVRLAPLFHGGGHEQGLRSGTLNVPGIVGFGKACQLALEEREATFKRVRRLRDLLRAQLQKALPGVKLNGGEEHRLPNNLNLSFEGVTSSALIEALEGRLALSSGSACAAKTPEPSYVLKAIGVPEIDIHQSIRFGLGKQLRESDVRIAARDIILTVQKLRKTSPYRKMDKHPIS